MQQGLVVSKSALDAVNAHIDKWQACTACPISTPRKIFFRGCIPCDVLIIGSGPSMNDEDVGKPMQDENGRVIDEIIDETIGKLHYEFPLNKHPIMRLPALGKDEPYRLLKTCITNSVLCRGPAAPDKEAIRACSSRLAEFILIAKPRLLIAAGKEAGSAIISLLAHLPDYPRSLEIRAPGYISRLSGDDRDTEMSRVKLQINQALQNVFVKAP